MSPRKLMFRAALLLSLAITTANAWAQSVTTGSIAGVVKDVSGAVLPGVTVEASSPALIEKTRSVVTDQQGQYKIVELRPGTYSISFGLEGFSSLKRDGVELTTGFTAAVNAELKVGAVSETLTVTGSTPIVDVQNTRTQKVFAHEVLDAVPTGKTFAAFITLTPGVSGAANGGVATRDVGGTQGEFPLGLRAHGSDAGLTSVDGIKTISTTGGDWRRLNLTDLYTQEVVLETSGGNAEAWSGGVNVNVVPKDGGNTFHGVLAGSGVGKGLDSNNLDDSLRSRGLTTYNQQKKMWDIGGSLGGPIKKDKAWFFVTPRSWGNEYYISGNYYNATPHTLFYTPDLSRPAIYARDQHDFSGRLTFQATTKDKVTISSNNGYQCFCPFAVEGGSVSPEAGAVYYYDPQRLVTAAWTHPGSSRLLFDGAVAWRNEGVRSERGDPSLTSVNDIAVLETTLGRTYGSQFSSLGPTDYGTTPSKHWLTRGSMSYVTGSHALKVGFTTLSEFGTLSEQPNFAYAYTFTNQRPISITEVAAPYNQTTNGFMFGLYGQDQWTIRRFTLNAGVRLDSIRQWSPAQAQQAGMFVAATTFPEVNGIPNWRDVNPRIGAAYDVFGNGKTAIKGSFGRYELSNSYSLAFGRNNSPTNTIVPSVSRTWNDVNGNFVPDCVLTNPLLNGECGQISNLAFGSTTTPNTVYAPDVKEGWFKSPHLWQESVALQQQLAERVGLSVGYYHTSYGNIYVTNNVNVTPSDYSPYCMTAPVDSRLPGGGGYPVCGLYDISPAKFGRVNNVVQLAPDRSQVTNTFDANLNARFGKGGLLSGGMSTGRTVTDNCSTPGLPPDAGGTGNAPAQYCRQTIPWSGLTEVKLSGVYPLPRWGIQTSATYQNLPGLARLANYTTTNSLIAPSLGRNLAACGAAAVCNAAVSVGLVPPFTLFEPRGQQVDVRVSKMFQFGRTRIQANADVFNLTNSNDVLSNNNAFGPTWLKPVSIIPGRLFKFGGQLTF